MYLARQLFVPAFLTLLLLGLVAGWCAPAAGETAAAAGVSPADAAEAGLAFALPDAALRHFEQAWPLPGRLAALLALLIGGIAVGRISVRSNIYGINTCLPIPLYGIFACCLGGTALSLPLLLVLMLFAYSVKRYCEAMRDGFSFDALFRASCALGMLLLIRPQALPLLLILPFGVVLFHRTRRETVVALAGLFFAPLLLCYFNWTFGGSFTAPAVALWNDFAAGLPAALFRNGFAPWMGVAAVLVLLCICGIGSVWANLYSVSARARYLLLFNIGTLLLALAVLAGPAAAPTDAALLAVPAAILLPFFFVRVHATLSSLLYLLLLTAAVVLRVFPLS